MPRIFHALALALLIGSAVYVYKIKYDTIGLRSEVKKVEKQIEQELPVLINQIQNWQQI